MSIREGIPNDLRTPLAASGAGRRSAAVLTGCVAAVFLLLTLTSDTTCAAGSDFGQPLLPLVTNVVQLRQAAAQACLAGCSVRLEGVVLWTNAGQSQIILQDLSGGIAVQMDLRAQPSVGRGQRVRLEGSCLAGAGTVREDLIDNDLIHSELTNSATVWLKAGLHPLKVAWFNSTATASLRVEYAGPDMPRQQIPDAVLFRPEMGRLNGEAVRWAHGLDYRCYDGVSERLPDFTQLVAIKTGVVRQFDLSVRSWDEDIGLVFSGYIQIRREGTYTFWLASDDGSRLYVSESSLRLQVLGPAELPLPRTVVPAQPMRPLDDSCWAQVDGVVTFGHAVAGSGAELQLSAGTNVLYLDVQTATGQIPPVNSRIRANGVVRGGGNPGHAPGCMLVPTLDNITILAPPPAIPTAPPLSVAELLRFGANGQRATCSAQVEGRVLAVSPSRSVLAFEDDSGVAMMELGTVNTPVRTGQQIRLAGSCTVQGPWLFWRSIPLVDNDWVHLAVEHSGTAVLKAGKHPVYLAWMNRDLPASLEVYVQGPDWPRQKVPDGALCRPTTDANGRLVWAQGLLCRAYEGSWYNVPDFAQLDPVRRETTANFDLETETRPDRVGLAFTGFIEIPRDGPYVFSTVSDDGSLLYVDEQPLRLSVVGTNAVVAPRHLTASQNLLGNENCVWAETSGTVTFAGETGSGLQLELSSGTGRLRVEVAEGTGLEPYLLLNSRLRVHGIWRPAFTADGQKITGTMVTPGVGQINMIEVAASLWNNYPVLAVGQVSATNYPSGLEPIVRVRGRVRGLQAGAGLVVEDDTGRVNLEATESPPPEGALVEVLGRWRRVGPNVVVQGGVCRVLPEQGALQESASTVLTTVEQVKGLSREQAQRGYRVKIRGVITTVLDCGFFIQDQTWGIYCRWARPADGDQPRVGDYWEVEGATFAEFAPNIRANRAVRLGQGTLPEPLRPTWDQLINGSLDTQYVEVQGIVTAVETGAVVLLTRAGKVKVELPELPAETLKRYENALIRARGCVIPGRNATTQQVLLGQLRLSNASVDVDEPAPADPFATARKRASDLLLFDSRAGAFQRVRIAGQLLHERGGEYFLVDGTNGLRFVPRVPIKVQVGDLVEVVGFPELGGPSPVLREALVRPAGKAELPAPHQLVEGGMLRRQYDATLVRVEARLVSLSNDRLDQVFEMQSSGRGFVARLESRRGTVRDIVAGSRLELTGIYAGQGGDAVSGRELEFFEVLLNSPEAVRVLERPSWWTLRHTLMVVGSMAVGMAAALVWISLLRRQVDERSRELAVEMRRREQTERQRALEEERARIAQDLHDDLGATLTQIKLLATIGSRDSSVPENTRSRMRQVSDKSREMVTSLDEIVWAVNPANDSLLSLATYLCQFAEEFFRTTSVRCRLDVDDGLPPAPLTSEVRHNLYLAVREGLNNVAKHSAASEVWLRIQWQEGGLNISIEDNGCGFTPVAVPGEGLVNMRRRLERIGGQFACETRPGAGTSCRIRLVLS